MPEVESGKPRNLGQEVDSHVAMDGIVMCDIKAIINHYNLFMNLKRHY